MTSLDKTLKRALLIGGVEYVITLTPEMLKVTRKGKRLGVELKWADIISGESALAVALQASVGQFEPVKNTNARVLSDKARAMPSPASRTKRPSKR